jgi:hypothetical protein
MNFLIVLKLIIRIRFSQKLDNKYKIYDRIELSQFI